MKYYRYQAPDLHSDITFLQEQAFADELLYAEPRFACQG